MTIGIMTILTEQNESLDAGKLKRIHINQHNIKYNAKNDDIKPVITIKSGKHNTYLLSKVIVT